MNDLISRKALLEKQYNTSPLADPSFAHMVVDVCDIEDAPAIEAEHVKRGRWIEDGDCQICSECGAEHAWDEYRATYCEDCGAKMDGGHVDG